MMAIPSALNDKRSVRKKFKTLRDELQRRAVAHVALRVNLVRFLLDYQDAQICLYRAQPAEVDCALEPIENFFYPRMSEDALEFYRPKTSAAFQAKRDILEPIPEQSVPWDFSRPSVICCPAVAVDNDGVRLGQGRGFYDRFFAEHPGALRIGVVFHVQVSADPLPAESWDQPLDWIVTEKMILRTRSPQRSSQSWT